MPLTWQDLKWLMDTQDHASPYNTAGYRRLPTVNFPENPQLDVARCSRLLNPSLQLDCDCAPPVPVQIVAGARDVLSMAGGTHWTARRVPDGFCFQRASFVEASSSYAHAYICNGKRRSAVLCTGLPSFAGFVGKLAWPVYRACLNSLPLKSWQGPALDDKAGSDTG